MKVEDIETMKKFLTALLCLATLFSLVFAGTAFAETGCYFCDNGKDCERHCAACPSDPTGKCPAHCYFCKNRSELREALRRLRRFG